MLLSAFESQLLIVDIQEKLLPAMQDGGRVVRQAGVLLEAAKALGIPVLASEQYPKGLGPTVPDVKSAIGLSSIWPKTHFSAYGEHTLREALMRDDGRKQIVLAGIEAHVCVLQTALDLKEAGREVYVVADATSSRQRESVDIAFARLRAAQVELVTTEMCVFEWLRHAGHAQFKKLSQLIK